MIEYRSDAMNVTAHAHSLCVSIESWKEEWSGSVFLLSHAAMSRPCSGSCCRQNVRHPGYPSPPSSLFRTDSSLLLVSRHFFSFNFFTRMVSFFFFISLPPPLVLLWANENVAQSTDVLSLSVSRAKIFEFPISSEQNFQLSRRFHRQLPVFFSGNWRIFLSLILFLPLFFLFQIFFLQLSTFSHVFCDTKHDVATRYQAMVKELVSKIIVTARLSKSVLKL